MNKKDLLTEATARALRGKLNEVYIKEYVETFSDLYDSSWGPAIEVLDRISELDLEDELMNWLEDLGTEDSPIDRTELNDYIIFQAEDIYDALGLDENGDPLDEGKKVTEKETTMRALRGKLNEWKEPYEDEYGKGITTRWYEVETEDGFLDDRFEDENEAIKVARTYKGDVFVYVTGSEKYTTGDYRGHSEPLDSVLLWQRKDGKEQQFVNSNAILEAKGSNKTYTCIEDRQGGDFAVGKTMTAEEWGEEAYSWAYGDDWTDPEEPLLKNFKTEQECLDFIQDMWEITIVPSDDPKAKEFLSEARSHKEDNEKAAPRSEFNTAPRYIKNSPYNEIDVPKRAIIHKSEKPNEDGVVWGVVNKDEIDTYEQSTPDIERYKEYKADAERERDNAKYYNALAKQSDARASDIVRDRIAKSKANRKAEARSHKRDKVKKESIPPIKTMTKVNKELKHTELNNSIKEYYTTAFAADDLGENINDITFLKLYRALKNKENIYDLIGVGDSVVRERLFNELARILNTTPKYVNDIWTYGVQEGQPNVIREARSHKEDNEKAAPRNDKDIFGDNINNFRKNTFHTTNKSILDKDDLAKRYKTGKKDYMNNDEYVIPNDEYTSITNKYKYARQSAKEFAKSVDYYEDELKKGNSINKNDLATVRGLRNKCSREANDILKQMRNKTKNTEARSHKEDNEKVAPRNKEQSFNGGPNKLSNKASGLAVGDKEKANTGVSKVLVGPEKGDIVGRDIKRNRVRSAEQSLNRKNAGQLDFGGTTDMQDYEVSPNQKSREYKKAHGKITRENKKVTEAIDENLKAYTVTVSDEENQHSFQFYAEKDKTLDDVFNEIYDYVIF